MPALEYAQPEIWTGCSTAPPGGAPKNRTIRSARTASTRSMSAAGGSNAGGTAAGIGESVLGAGIGDILRVALRHGLHARARLTAPLYACPGMGRAPQISPHSLVQGVV